MTRFSAELPVWFSCVREYGFLGVPKNSEKNYRKSTHPEGPWARIWARGGPPGPRCLGGASTPLAARGGRMGGSHTLWFSTLDPIFTLDGETPEQKSFSQFSSRSRRHLCSSPGELKWRLFWPMVRGDRRHRRYHRHSTILP